MAPDICGEAEKPLGFWRVQKPLGFMFRPQVLPQCPRAAAKPGWSRQDRC